MAREPHKVHEKVESMPPPIMSVGVARWLRENLFSSPTNVVLTFVVLYVLYLLIPPLAGWALFDAVWEAGSRKECRALDDGACWAVVSTRFDQFVFGDYPKGERWRPSLAFILLLVSLVPVLFDKIPGRSRLLLLSLAYPGIAYILLIGGFGLQEVETSRFGGFLLTIVIGVTGIATSLPLGILLALGRQSNLFIVRVLSVGFIEFIRGVPLITLLFVASTLLNYFMPPGTTFDLLVRVLIMVSLFSAAYLAEVIRGGLQAIPGGQYEAARSMGLPYWKMMQLIILPQALKISIPGIVNSFIALFKDTTLVITIGLLDPLGIGKATLADTTWQGLSTEVYVFVAIFFFICCFGMSRYSLYLERRLHTGH